MQNGARPVVDYPSQNTPFKRFSGRNGEQSVATMYFWYKQVLTVVGVYPSKRHPLQVFGLEMGGGICPWAGIYPELHGIFMIVDVLMKSLH